MVRPRSGPPGFTLIEMLVVIAIIGILAGMIMVGVSAARRNFKKQQTQHILNLVKSSIENYEADFREYPDSLSGDPVIGGENLLAALRTDQKEGPYIKAADPVKFKDTNDNGDREIVDAFNRPLRYLHHKDYGREPPNSRTYRLWSVGMNGRDDMDEDVSDDLTNWTGADEDDRR
jgi:prepilin-type N-terminal cleavage/methylation domain-containing protein